MVGAVLALLVGLARADCPDRGAVLSEIEAALLEAELDTAAEGLTRFEEALACGEIASAEQLARMWQAEAVLRHLQQRDQAAIDAFSAAARVAPGVWNPDFGVELESLYKAAASRPQGIGQLTIEPELGHWEGYVDGKRSSFPTNAIAGLHVVQVLGPDGVGFAKHLFLAQKQTFAVETDLAPIEEPWRPEPEPAPPPILEPTARRSVPPLAVASGALVGLGIGGLIAAKGQDPIMKLASDREALDAAFTRQKVFGYAGYGLIGVGATVGVLHIAL